MMMAKPPDERMKNRDSNKDKIKRRRTMVPDGKKKKKEKR